MSLDDTGGLVYNASPTGERFHTEQARERWVVGPVGSGKTSMAIMELFLRMVNQAPHPRTKRRQTRFIVIRESYPQLVSTTIKSFQEWIGQYGKFSGQSPIRWKCDMELPDGTILDAEVLFYAMSEGFDTAKLRSLEVTGGYLSEFAEIDAEVIDVLATRFRFPKTYTKEHDGFDHGPSWTGMFGESNPPSVNSHWYHRFEVERPAGCVVIRQPGALTRTYDEQTKAYVYHDNPSAENIAYLPGGFQYYHNMIASMSDEAIDVLVLGNYGRDMSGRPVYPSFNREKHVVPADQLVPNPNFTVLIGIDPGLNAAAALGQMQPSGALAIFDEVVTTDLTFEQFIDDHLIPVLRSKKYDRCKFEAVIDPSAKNRNAMSDLTPVAMLRQKGIAARLGITNKIEPRIKAVEHFLAREGRLLVSDACATLVSGFEGGYRRAKVKGVSGKVFKPEPEKNEYSHVHDGAQYLALEMVAAADLQRIRAAHQAGRAQRGRMRLA